MAVKEAFAGDIVVAGITNILIGDTVCDKDNIRPMHPIEEPTMSMNFLVNKSRLLGKLENMSQPEILKIA